MATITNKTLAASAEDGAVFLDGEGLAATLTPEAAADLSDLLLKAAAQAAGQRLALRHDLEGAPSALHGSQRRLR